MNCKGSRRKSRGRREEPTWRELVDAVIGRNSLKAATRRTVKVISAPLINNNNNNNSDCDSSSSRATTMSPPPVMTTEDVPGAPLAFASFHLSLSF